VGLGWFGASKLWWGFSKIFSVGMPFLPNFLFVPLLPAPFLP